jgi:hypothetical protein
VIKTVPFDVLFSFIIGLFIVLACGRQVKSGRRVVLNHYFLGAVLFEFFFYIPIGIYLYYFHTDWSWMYFFNPASLSPATIKALGLLAITSYMLALIAGFQLGQFLIRRNRDKTALRILIICLAVLGLFSLATLHRLLYIGDYSSWKNGLAVLLLTHRVGYINLAMAVTGGAALFFMIMNFRREKAAT